MTGFSASQRSAVSETVSPYTDRFASPRLLEQERAGHDAFARTRRRAYVENAASLRRLDDHADLSSDDNVEAADLAVPLVISGDSGSGKSALLAYWSEEYRRRHPDSFVVSYYIGATSSSGNHVELLRRVLLEVRQRAGIDDDVPDTAEGIEREFPLWLGRLQRERMILVIDALDQLEEGSKGLAWMPEHFPANVRVVVSTTPGSILQSLRSHGWGELKIRPLSLKDRMSVVKRYLGEYGGQQDERFSRIASEPTSANPLFLRTRLEEVRSLEPSEELNQKIDHYLAARDLDDLFQRVLERIEREHGAKVTRDATSLMWASRRGLTEEDLAATSGHTRPKLHGLLVALKNHLMNADGVLLFAHDRLRQAVENRYVGEGAVKLHKKLAKYFTYHSNLGRRADELPWQLQRAGDMKGLRRALVDLSIFSTLYSGGRQYELLAYWNALDLRSQMAREYRKSIEEFEASDVSQIEIADMFRQLGRFFVRAGNFDDAEPLLRRAASIREEIYGEEHPDTLDSLADVIDVGMEKGRFKDVLELARRVAEIRERTLGPRHDDTLDAWIEYARTLHFSGRLEESADTIRQCLAIAERTKGPDHLKTAYILAELAPVLAGMARYDESEQVQRRALEIRVHILGANHIDSAQLYHNLAATVRMAGRGEAAEELHRKGLEIYESTLGKDHPQLIIPLANGGNMLRDLKQYAAAEEMLQRAITICRKYYGEEYIYFFQLLHFLGTVYLELKRFDQAEEMYERALVLVNKYHGAESFSGAVCAMKLGELYRHQQDFSRAVPMLERALELLRINGREQSSDFAAIHMRLGQMILLQEGDLDLAEEHLRIGLEIFRHSSSPGHRYTVLTMELLEEIHTRRHEAAVN